MPYKNNMISSASKRYDMLKVFTTFLVVFAHASRMYTGQGVVMPMNKSEILMHCTWLIYSFHMPLFMCVTGMVYGLCIDDLGKYDNTIKFIKSKAKRLLIPYLFWGIFYVAPIMVWFGFTDQSYVEYCINGIVLAQNSRHLWFILTLFFIFVICAVYREICKKVKIHLHWIVLLLITLLLYILAGAIPTIFCMQSVASYLIYFYFGILLNRVKRQYQSILINPFISILLFVSFIYIYKFVHPILSTPIAILFIYNLSFIINEKLCENKLFLELKMNGFGIYIFHPMIIYILFYFWGNLNFNPIILCCSIFIISYILSYLLSVFFRKVHLGFLLGE